jgi:WD40 repeat protein
VTPDGRRAVSASWDQTVRMWDLESGAMPGCHASSLSPMIVGTLTGEVLQFDVRGISLTAAAPVTQSSPVLQDRKLTGACSEIA